MINYRTSPEWHTVVRELTGGRGVDQVIAIGGGTMEQSIKSTALDGQINFVGRVSKGATAIDTSLLYNSVATIRVIFAGNRDQFIAMNRAIAVNRLKPLIDRAFSFIDLPAAFQYFGSGRNFGKVVITHN